MKLSKHFDRKEFLCQCRKCSGATADAELINVLEDIREYFDTPVKITSGYRCKEHNEAIGGSFKSMHMLGIAADIQVVGISPHKIYNYLTNKYPMSYGIGDGSLLGFVHIDVREIKARWAY